jgi:hypothetical protein
MRLLRHAIAVIICLALFGLAGAVQASDTVRLNDYLVRATGNPSGQNYCTLAMRFSDGNTITFAKGLNGSMTMALDYAQSNLSTRFSAGIFTDGSRPAFDGRVVSDRLVVFRIPDGTSGFQTIANQSDLAIRIGGRKLQIPIHDQTARQAFGDFNTCLANLAPVTPPAIQQEKMKRPKIAKLNGADKNRPAPSTKTTKKATQRSISGPEKQNVKIATKSRSMPDIEAKPTLAENRIAPVIPERKPAIDSAGVTDTNISIADVKKKPVVIDHPIPVQITEKVKVISDDRRIPDIADTRWTLTENNSYRMNLISGRIGNDLQLNPIIEKVIRPMKMEYTALSNQKWQFGEDHPLVTGQYIEISTDRGLAEHGLNLLDQKDQSCDQPIQSAIGIPHQMAGVTIMPVEWQCGNKAGASVLAKDHGETFRIDLTGPDAEIKAIERLRNRLMDQLTGISRI